MNKCHKFFIYLFSLILIILINGSAQAQGIGKVIFSMGECFSGNRSLSRGSDIFVGETIRTGNNGNLQIRFSDNGLIALRPNSQYAVNSYQLKSTDSQGNMGATLAKGQLRMLSGLISKQNPQGFKLKTKTSVIGVHGTDLEVITTSVGDFVIVFPGGEATVTSLLNPSSSMDIGDNQAYAGLLVNAESGEISGLDRSALDRILLEASTTGEIEEHIDEALNEEDRESLARTENIFMNELELGTQISITEELQDILDELALEEEAELHDDEAGIEESLLELFDTDTEDHV